MVKYDLLGLRAFKHVKGQKLSQPDEEKRLMRTNHLLRKKNNEMVARTFFTDEKMFTVDTPRNSQNNRVYSHAKHKNEI